MKKIIAYIRHNKADIVIEKLEEAGVKGMTLLDTHWRNGLIKKRLVSL